MTTTPKNKKPAKGDDEKDERVTLLMPPSLVRRLEAQAARNNRSRSGEGVFLIKQGLADTPQAKAAS